MLAALEGLEAQIRAARRAADTADRIASLAIRFSIRKRAEAGEALTQARHVLKLAEFLAWVEQQGLTVEAAEAALAERWSALPKAARRRELPPVLAPQRRNGVPQLLERGFDRA